MRDNGRRRCDGDILREVGRWRNGTVRGGGIMLLENSIFGIGFNRGSLRRNGIALRGDSDVLGGNGIVGSEYSNYRNIV